MLADLKDHDSIFIFGPTASGKSALALAYAAHYQGEIINADSRQLYGGLKILSAHPRDQDLADVPHHLYGVLNPEDTTKVSAWCDWAHDAFQGVVARGKLPIYVGGTGLYLKALLEGLHPFPDISPDARQKVRDDLDTFGAEVLYQRLAEKGALPFHSHDAQRLQRALELYEQTGQTLEQLKKEPKRLGPALNPLVISMDIERPRLHHRIWSRLGAMVDQGVVAEVEEFLSEKIPYGATFEETIGFLEIKGYLEGRSKLEEALEKIFIRTRQYAKRQQTWGRHQIQPHILYVPSDRDDLPMGHL